MEFLEAPDYGFKIILKTLQMTVKDFAPYREPFLLFILLESKPQNAP